MPSIPARSFSFFSLGLAIVWLMSACSPYIRTEMVWQSALSVDHSLVGDIVRTSDLRRVQPDQLLSELASADYLLIGEKHDNPDHHHLQNWLLTELLPNTKYNLVFEMLDYSQQEAIAKLNTNTLPDEISGTAKFDESGWPSKFYTPLIQTGLAKGANLLAGNIPKTELMQIYKTGFDELNEIRFKTVGVIDGEPLKQLEQEIYDQHCGMLPKSQTAPMARIQIAKDASMAYSMNTPGKSILIAGNYHVNKLNGVPKHLSELTPERKTLVIQIIEVSDDYETVAMLNSEKLKQADYLWFTPRWTDKDYCDDMRTHAKKQ